MSDTRADSPELDHLRKRAEEEIERLKTDADQFSDYGDTELSLMAMSQISLIRDLLAAITKPAASTGGLDRDELLYAIATNDDYFSAHLIEAIQRDDFSVSAD